MGTNSRRIFYKRDRTAPRIADVAKKQESDPQSIADVYIEKMQRIHGRSLPSFTKFLIRNFVKTAGKQMIFPQSAKKDPSAKVRVAMIMQSVGYFTGGRYYAWFIAMALVELGYDVTIYTDRESGFYSDVAKYYKQPNMEILVRRPQELETLDVEADIYIGVPSYGNIGAISLGQKYNKPVFVMVFDPFPMMNKYLGYDYGGWDEIIFQIKKNNVNIISLCNATSEYIYPWLNKKKENVFEIYPCINSREKDNALRTHRDEEYIIFVSRIVDHKKFDHVLDAVKQTNLKLKVVTSLDGATTKQLIHDKGMDGRVDFYFRCSDQEKFDLIYGAKAMINGAIFEGFGVWAAEAISCGIPLVCYDYPTLAEIKQFAKADNVYLAKLNDPDDLARKLAIAIKEKKFTKGTNIFNFEALVARVADVFKFEPRIGVVMIALNEQQFIKASLSAVARHPNVKRIGVVEGADNLFSHAATEKGLSIDKTRDEIFQAIKSEHGHKIAYQQYGWANDKAELRNRALELVGKDVDYILMVDADEVWDQDELTKLATAMKENRNAGVLSFGFYHFFKNIRQIAVGGQWNSYMFRCFKYEDKSLFWGPHQLPVINYHGRSILDSDGMVRLDDVKVHHLGYVKEDKRIEEKLEYYKKRDKQLNVDTNWKGWKKGDPTSFTHHTGDIEAFTGTYPEEIKKLFRI